MKQCHIMAGGGKTHSGLQREYNSEGGGQSEGQP